MSNTWHETLPATLNRAWSLLERGTKDGRHAARFPTLATISETGPQQRTLALRKANRADATLTLYTDAATPKVTELTKDARASLHIWDQTSQIQLRIAATVVMEPGTAEIWEQMPQGARTVYGVEPPPGTPISDPEGFDRTPNFKKFLELTLHVRGLELVALGLPVHRRAVFRAADRWTGQWLAP